MENFKNSKDHRISIKIKQSVHKAARSDVKKSYQLTLTPLKLETTSSNRYLGKMAKTHFDTLSYRQFRKNLFLYHARNNNITNQIIITTSQFQTPLPL